MLNLDWAIKYLLLFRNCTPPHLWPDHIRTLIHMMTKTKTKTKNRCLSRFPTPKINEGSNNNGDPEGSFLASSAEKLRYPILSKLGVLPSSSDPQENKLNAISDILDEVLLFWWENRHKKTNDKLIINYRNNSNINLVPMTNTKTPRYKHKNLKIMMKCTGDGDVISEFKIY